MKKRMTIVVILDDSKIDAEKADLKDLSSKTNAEWEAEMRSSYGTEPSMELVSVVVEDIL